jgi:hypothetical protein
MQFHTRHRPLAVRIIEGELRQSLANSGQATLRYGSVARSSTDVGLLREDREGAVFMIAPTQLHTIESSVGAAVLVISGPRVDG